MRPGVRRTAAAAALALLGLPASTAACAADPDPSPPAGVDGLTVPTPSPDPDDFDDEVDNPWLALQPGSTTTLVGLGGTATLAVAEDPVTVAGVVATPVTLTDPRGSVTDLLAQDEDGNVWWLGREGVFTAGVDGAQAGLLMAATPRYGDGHRAAYAEGAVEAVAEVTVVDGDTVEVTTTDAARPGEDQVATYERGTGLVRLETAGRVFER